MRRGLLLLAPLVLAGSLYGRISGVARGSDEPTLEHLLGALLRADDDTKVEAALDAIAARVGAPQGFRDQGALADWLGRIAPSAAKQPRVLLRRGYAYVAVGRGQDAIEPLTEAAATERTRTAATAYLGEAYRQSGDPARALEVLAEAARLGYEPSRFLDEAALKAAFSIRQNEVRQAAKDLPRYAAASAVYLASRPSPAVEAAVARWLLDDADAYAPVGSEREARWSAFAAKEAVAAVRADPTIAGGPRLCYDAALGLAAEDARTGGRTLYFDCLACAYRLGRGPDRDTHEIPQAIALLAEAALREGRYRLALRLARERLAVSDSPLAREVLRDLPPDVAD